MKILYVITSTHTGGAEKALAALVMQTVKEHQVKVVSLKPLGPVAQELEKSGAEVVSLNMKGIIPFGIVKKLQAEILSFQPDIVHAMLFRGIELTRLACAGQGLKLISTPHFDLSKKNFILRFIDKLLKDLDTLTVAESFSTARYLVEKQHYQKDKVFLLPNGADKTVFFSDESLRRNMRTQYGFTADNTVFISVARLAPVKDPVTLLQAFRNVWRGNSAARLVYVGEGEERPKLENFIRQSGMEEAVLLAGEQRDINAWLNMADVFVLTSVEESLPIALLEALRVGLPCVVTNVGDMSLWVEHGKNGFVCKPGDILLLSCFLTELLSREKREELQRGGVKISQRIGDTSPQYQHLYQQIYLNSFHVKTNCDTKK
ncbi:MAG: glycosyltransferase [Elusimicrobia bacterium]|nr:glycosyltransferase [Elusimicrobiota bacterium]